MNDFAFPAFLTQGNGAATLVAFKADDEQPVYMANDSHPHWDAILSGLRDGDPDVWDLFDVASGVLKAFEQVTDRVSWNGSEILWDGDPVHSALADHLSRAIEDGDSKNYTALAKFWEKLESNPDEHSREQAFDWLACHRFQITEDGDVVGYKGVVPEGYASDGTEVYLSAWASSVAGVPSAYVNGNPIKELSKVPQRIGDVVTMPRSEVAHNPSVACSRGLHVATRSYAASYGTVLEVHVNPRDIVSVPTDAHGEKVRVCRYTVARVAVDNGDDRPVLHDTGENVWAGDVGYKP